MPIVNASELNSLYSGYHCDNCSLSVFKYSIIYFLLPLLQVPLSHQRGCTVLSLSHSGHHLFTAGGDNKIMALSCNMAQDTSQVREGEREPGPPG